MGKLAGGRAATGAPVFTRRYLQLRDRTSTAARPALDMGTGRALHTSMPTQHDAPGAARRAGHGRCKSRIQEVRNYMENHSRFGVRRQVTGVAK